METNTTQAASRFVELANLPFSETRPTAQTAKTLRDELLFSGRRRPICGRCR